MKTHCSLLLVTIFLTVIGLAVVQLLVSNKLSTSGVLLSSLRNEILYYKQENEVLKTDIAKALSITSLAHRAKEIGFVRDNSPLVLTGAQSFALK